MYTRGTEFNTWCILVTNKRHATFELFFAICFLLHPEERLDFAIDIFVPDN